MKKKNFLIFLMFVFSGTLIYFVYKRIGVREVWEKLSSFSLEGIFVILGIMGISHLIGIFRWQTILKNGKAKINFKNLVSSWFLSFSVTFFIPFILGAAETTRAYSLKRKEKKVSLKKSFSSVLIDKILEGTTSFLMIFLGVVFLILYSLSVSIEVWIFFLLFLIPIGAIIYFYVRAFKSQSMAKIVEKPLKKILNHRVKNVLEIEKEIFKFFELKNKKLRKSIGLALLRQLIDFLACFSILFFMGIKLTLPQAIAIIGFIYISYYLIPIPAAFGVLEIIQALVFTQIGFNPQAGVAFVLLFRSFNFVFAMLGVAFGFRSILHWLGEKMLQISDKNNKA